MRWYIQYYTAPGKQALGDRGVVIADGRLNLANVAAIALRDRRGNWGYQLLRGESLLRCRPFTREIPYD